MMGKFSDNYVLGLEEENRRLKTELEELHRERSNYRAVLEGAEYQNITLIGKETRDCRQIGERAVEITQGIIDERNELRVEVDQQAKIIGKSIDDSDKWAMEKRGMEVDLDRMKAQLEAVGEFIESRKTYFPENSLGCVEIHIADGGVDKLDALLQPDSGKGEG